VTDLIPPKLQEMFCHLLLFRDRPHPRETLASLLWPASSTAQSKRNLRQALWQLQRSDALRDGSDHSDLFLVDAHWIRLNPEADLWLDVEVLEQVFSRVEGVPGRALDAAQVQALREAVELYQGDLLEDFFQDWCLYERERLQSIYLCVLDKLMDHSETSGQYEAGLVYGARALQWDGARERTYRRLMRLYYLSGERSAAMRQYDLCVQALRRELDVAPSERTIALYQQVRNGRLRARPRTAGPRGRQIGPDSSERSELLGQLRQMQRDLARLQGQLGDAIRRAERVGGREAEPLVRQR
jgi:DNA-binding SARP family transcriptional activator